MDTAYQPRLYYQLALTQYKLQQYSDAASNFGHFLLVEKKSEDMLSRAKTYQRNALFAAQAIQHPVPFTPVRLPETINSSSDEYWATLSSDGGSMMFTRRVNNQEDFFHSRQENGTWQEAQPIAELNSPLNEGIHCLSGDGHTLIFTACQRPDGLGGCDLYTSTLNGGHWTNPINLKAPINTASWETQPSLSANGQILFFVSDRPGGLGGLDLWMSRRQVDGSWAAPTNLGKNINTKEDEQAPFIHPDGRTLYFMSKGHPGMGGYDLYLSRIDEKGEWSEPQNLGYPINTTANEGAIHLDLEGKTAYFDSDQFSKTPGTANTRADIFQFELPEQDRPLAVTYAKGIVQDKTTQKNLAALVEIIDLSSGKRIFSANTDLDGSFLACLPMGYNYALNVSKKGYLFYSENFALQEQRNRHEPYQLAIKLQPVPAENSTTTKPEPVILRNVFFALGKAVLETSSFPELQRLVQLLQTYPNLRIQINGHTDDIGADADNQKLSEQRAKAVYEYLIQNGITAQRLAFKGFGESKPIAPNTTAEGRQLNRRTEFVVQ
jgi:outer membrane protein OmpA-like peptidoglycan-associated protein